jgi:hypothetical protein
MNLDIRFGVRLSKEISGTSLTPVSTLQAEKLSKKTPARDKII